MLYSKFYLTKIQSLISEEVYLEIQKFAGVHSPSFPSEISLYIIKYEYILLPINFILRIKTLLHLKHFNDGTQLNIEDL